MPEGVGAEEGRVRRLGDKFRANAFTVRVLEALQQSVWLRFSSRVTYPTGWPLRRYMSQFKDAQARLP